VGATAAYRTRTVSVDPDIGFLHTEDRRDAPIEPTIPRTTDETPRKRCSLNTSRSGFPAATAVLERVFRMLQVPKAFVSRDQIFGAASIYRS